MITSPIVMLSLQNFGHMALFTNDLSHLIKFLKFLTISSNLALLQLPNENLYSVSREVNSPNKK